MGFEILSNRRNRRGKFDELDVGPFWWRAMVDLTFRAAPDIASRCRYWTSNDWDGLDEARSLDLSKAIQRRIDSCAIDADAHAAFPPNGCDDYDEPFEDTYLSREEQQHRFVEEYVETAHKFVTFLEGCGGFVIA